MDPDTLERIAARAAEVGFDAASASAVGELLTALAASKPGGRLLELGTGAGRGTACLLRGMDADARLVTVELDAQLSAIAQTELRDDRVEWVVADGCDWLAATTEAFDLVFADTWPGKFTHLDQALALVTPGGFYVIDDLLPHPNWPDEHQAAVDDLLATLRARPGWVTAYVDDASGVLLGVRR
ncbi:O-methyltransferase [Nocardioides astragali]|uniref:O-methyltransferase n=1 Tax=Nocardioides astragali TaxID=1776736 RepID=A0ABW2MZ55_9ACTN